jgi:hypothetical protein
MRIKVRRSGGYGGEEGTLVVDLDTDSLGPSSSARLKRLIREADFFRLPDVVQGAGGMDLVRYEIGIHDGNRSHQTRFEDDGGPETTDLMRLVKALEQIGKAGT